MAWHAYLVVYHVSSLWHEWIKLESCMVLSPMMFFLPSTRFLFYQGIVTCFSELVWYVVDLLLLYTLLAAQSSQDLLNCIMPLPVHNLYIYIIVSMHYATKHVQCIELCVENILMQHDYAVSVPLTLQNHIDLTITQSLI